MYRPLLVFVTATLLLVWLVVSVSAIGPDSHFKSVGDVSVTVDDAEASIIKNRANIVTLNIATSPASLRKLKQSYSVNLFFSKDFEPKPGKYPIEFGYRNKKNTLGGSFFSRAGRFSHDTKGEAEFLEFGERIQVRFEFQTYDKSEGSEGRKMVAVSGMAVCPGSDLF